MARNELERGTRVRANLEVQKLSKAGSALTLQVFSDGEILGTMVIGKGTLSWYHGSAKKGRYLRWRAFDKLMEDHGKIPKSR